MGDLRHSTSPLIRPPSPACRFASTTLHQTLPCIHLLEDPTEIHAILDLKHRLAYLASSVSGPGDRHFLVVGRWMFPVLRLYPLHYQLETHTTSDLFLLRILVSRIQSNAKRQIRRSSSVSDHQKNKMIGIPFSEVWLVHDNRAQEAVIVDYHFPSLILMKLDQDIGELVLILLHHYIRMIDLPTRIVGCRTVRLGILQVRNRVV
jgi:hypothetical protein